MMIALTLPLSPAEGEGSREEGPFRGRTGVLGVSPILFKIPPRMGDNRGLISGDPHNKISGGLTNG
jgi:hypothetical protein